MSRPYWYVIRDPAGFLLENGNDDLVGFFKFHTALEAIQFRLNTEGCVVYGAREQEDGTLDVLPYPHANQTFDREVASMKLSGLLESGHLRGKPLADGAIDLAILNGLLSKQHLVDGRYYYGHCRNARVARWDANGKPRGVEDGPTGRFVHIRHKFGDSFPESINHPEDDNGYDFFIPVAEIQPLEVERVSDESLRSTTR